VCWHDNKVIVGISYTPTRSLPFEDLLGSESIDSLGEESFHLLPGGRGDV
jgi:hypothetical protein